MKITLWDLFGKIRGMSKADWTFVIFMMVIPMIGVVSMVWLLHVFDNKMNEISLEFRKANWGLRTKADPDNCPYVMYTPNCLDKALQHVIDQTKESGK